MYYDIGGKIKILAKVECVIGVIVSVILGFVLKSNLNSLWWLFILIGAISSLISSWLIYGFGELIDDVHIIAYNINNNRDE